MADANYQTQSFRVAAGQGVFARQVYDAPQTGAPWYWNADNLQSREEGALSSRFGLAALTTNGINQNFPLGAAVNSLSRMQGIGTPYRYAATTAGSLFRRAGNSAGAYSSIAAGLSGGRVSMSPYRPANSSAPWQFIADGLKLLKDNGTLSAAENWGIAPPLQPALIAPVVPGLIDVELFDESTDASFTLANLTSAAMLGRVQFTTGSAVTATGPQFVIVEALTVNAGALVRTTNVTEVTFAGHGFVTGMRIAVSVNNTADNSFVVSSAVITVIDSSHFTYPNTGANQTSVSTFAFLNPAPSLEVGMSITSTDANAETVFIEEVFGSINFGTTPPGFVATFTKTHAINTTFFSNYLSGSVAANTLATVTKTDILDLSFPAAQVAADQNYVQFYVLLSNPLAVSQINLLFDVGDGSFTQDYYSKAIVTSVAQPLASGTIGAKQIVSQGLSGRATGTVNFSTLGGSNPGILPTDMPLLGQLQPTSLDPGQNVWTLIQVPLASFVQNGAAGGPNNNWANIVAWRLSVQTNPTLSTTVGFDDLAFVGGSDLNSFAGQPYDYRFTYVNLNTGCESNPSQTMVATDATLFPQWITGASVPVPLSVQQQAIQVTALASPDAQVTHWNLYRRGGSLTQAWYFVAQIPIGTLTYIDTIADATIEVNNQLLVDSDAPVTSLLATPLNTSITLPPIHLMNAGPGLVTVPLTSGSVKVGQAVNVGAGSTFEQCYVYAISGSNVTLYLQLNYNTTASPLVVALTSTTSPGTPMNLSAIAFDQAFLAGDPNNPHVLYYSRTYSPETFPQENFIEVGTPDSPIMALAVLKGFLYVLTTKTIWQIFGGQGSQPVAVPTGVMHGLAASWAWAASENIIYYLSYDGVYAFTGSGSSYMTQNTEWIWTSRTETNGVIPVLNQAQKPNVFMAYGNHEVFAAYIDQNGTTHRQISHESYGYRWRNDDQAAGNITAMFFEQDTGQLIVGKDDGMVYIDQVNDFDDGGWGSGGQIKNPIAINLQTPQLDLGVPKAYKNFAEITIDATLPVGVVITPNALFDSQATEVGLDQIVGTGSRTQYQLNVNNALGYRSLNMGLILTGNTTAQAIFHEFHVRAVIEAEERVGYDSYKLDWGSASWKTAKQCWHVYAAPDPDGIEMAVYIDDNPIPVYVYTLPQTPIVNTRTTVKVRFPPLKFRIMRLVGTSDSPFQMYTKDTECEIKFCDASKGWQKMALST
jgi:hypothetical protein